MDQKNQIEKSNSQEKRKGTTYNQFVKKIDYQNEKNPFIFQQAVKGWMELM